MCREPTILMMDHLIFLLQLKNPPVQPDCNPSKNLEGPTAWCHLSAATEIFIPFFLSNIFLPLFGNDIHYIFRHRSSILLVIHNDVQNTGVIISIIDLIESIIINNIGG